MEDQLEIYVRGEDDAPRPTTADLAPQTPGDPTDVDIPPGFDNVENNWMIDYPQAFVIPKGDNQRSDPEARRLVRWLFANGIQVRRLKKGYQYDATTRFEQDSWVVFMDQPLEASPMQGWARARTSARGSASSTRLWRLEPRLPLGRRRR